MTHLIPDSDYFAFDAINSSRLKEATKSMKHFFEYESKPATEAMKLGTALHSKVEGKVGFDLQYALVPGDWRKAEAKKEIEIAKASGKEPLKPKDFKNIFGMHKALYEHKTAKSVFWGGNVIEKEQGFWWEHESGLKLKCKPDAIRKGKKGHYTGWDLKKVQDASEKGFQKQCRDYQLELQCALYSMGLSKRFGDKFTAYYFVLVEEKPPHGIGIYQILPIDLEQIQAWINEKLWEIHEIKAKGLPVYSYSNPDEEVGGVRTFGIQMVDLPPYIVNKYITDKEE